MWRAVFFFFLNDVVLVCNSGTLALLLRQRIFAFKNVTIGRLSEALISTGIMQGSVQSQIIFVSCWGGA